MMKGEGLGKASPSGAMPHPLSMRAGVKDVYLLQDARAQRVPKSLNP